eukprot:124622-Pleurochrysis_carterae.AAC.1
MCHVHASQASCKDYDSASNTYRRRVLLRNPHGPVNDYRGDSVIYVPSIFPSLYKFIGELTNFTREHKLSVVANGRIAFQSLETIVAEVAHETACVQ